MLPEQERRHIPSEIVEEILVNLRVKPLLRFSSVSKSWNSMIFDPKFIRRQRKMAASCRERIRIVSHCSLENISAASTSCTSSFDDATPLIFPFKVEGDLKVRFLASCDDLWCVQYSNSIYLWNPSTCSYKKLPHPSNRVEMFCFGLGYDSLGDDYKIVKIHKFPPLSYGSGNIDTDTQAYSLRNDSWRKSKPFLGLKGPREPGVTCNGALHWAMYPIPPDVRVCAIVSFNLSTEKYAEVALPQGLQHDHCYRNLAVLRERLCLHVNYETFVLWEMEEYGVAESWTKRFVIDHSSLGHVYYERSGPRLSVRPVYFYDDDEKLLIKTDNLRDKETKFILYTDEKTKAQTVFSDRDSYDICHLYLESLVSPAHFAPASTS